MEERNIAITNWLYATLLVIFVYIVWMLQETYSYWKKRGLEYLTPIIPFGNASSLLFKQQTIGVLVADWYNQLKNKGYRHGGTYLCFRPCYIPTDPHIIKSITATDFHNFPHRGLFLNETNAPLTGHIFAIKGPTWRTLRAKSTAAFSSAKIKRMFEIMKTLSSQMILNLDHYADNSRPMNVKEELRTFITDVSLACIFEEESGTMRNQNLDLVKHIASYMDYQFSVYKLGPIFAFSHDLLRSINFKIIKKDTESYLMDMFRSIINKKNNRSVFKGDLTDVMMQLMELKENERDFNGNKMTEGLSFGEFSAHMGSVLGATFGTALATQTFAMFELAKNPECQIKLREEIERVLERHNNELTYEALQEMNYLDKVVNETLRLYPALPVLIRVCEKDYRVPETDVTIERGTLVLISSLGIQRDAEFYPNPDQFDPERFSKENKSKIPSGAYIPFGLGPRICVGQRFGLLQAKMGILPLVRNYEISLNNKTTKSFRFSVQEFMLRKNGDVWIDLKKIKK